MGRSKLVPPGLEYIADNIVQRCNILGASPEQSAGWARGLGLPRGGETVFFAGCGYQYGAGLESLLKLMRFLDRSAIGTGLPLRLAALSRKLGIDAAGIYRRLAAGQREADFTPLRAAVAVLRRLGVEFGYLAEEEPCCGASLYFTGLRDEFARNARQTCDRLRAGGVRRIIGLVPSCTYALRDLFPRYVDGYDIEVRHFVEVVAEGLPSLRLEFPREVRAVFHDPCQLGRFLGLVSEPRQILNAVKGLTLLEPAHTSGEWATCCGGGGGFEAVYPEMSRMLAENRARELTATGADIVITHCPGCVLQLREGLENTGAGGVAVLDLAEVIALAMEGG